MGYLVWILFATAFGFFWGRDDAHRDFINACGTKQEIAVQDTRIGCRLISVNVNGTELKYEPKEK